MRDSADSSNQLKVWYGACTLFLCQDMTNENLSFPLLSPDTKNSWDLCHVTSCHKVSGYWSSNIINSCLWKLALSEGISCIDAMLHYVSLCNSPTGRVCACARMRGRAHCVHVIINTQTFLLTSCTAKYYPSTSCCVFFKCGCLSRVLFPAVIGTCQISHPTVSLALSCQLYKSSSDWGESAGPWAHLRMCCCCSAPNTLWTFVPLSVYICHAWGKAAAHSRIKFVLTHKAR